MWLKAPYSPGSGQNTGKGQRGVNKSPKIWSSPPTHAQITSHGYARRQGIFRRRTAHTASGAAAIRASTHVPTIEWDAWRWPYQAPLK